MILTLHPQNPEYNFASFLSDPFFTSIRKKAALELRDVRFFLDDPETPIQKQSRNYMNWLRHIGVSKNFAKWIVPLWTTETPRAIAREVYGYTLGPIVQLGERGMSAYIRYLLFTRGWSQDGVAKHLVDELDYPYNRARPMVRRIMRSEAHQREYHATSGEAKQFSDLLVPVKN